MIKGCAFVFLALLAFSNAADFEKNSLTSAELLELEPYGIFEDLVNKTLESIRAKIPDPLTVAELALTLPGGGLDGSGRINDLVATGLAGYQTTFLKVSALNLQLNFTLEFATININTKYWLDILIASLAPFYGEGRANINLEQLTISGSGHADLSNGVKITNIWVQITIGDAVFDIHGLLNDESFSLLVSQVLNDVIAKFINEHQDLISKVLSPIIEAVLGLLLAGDATTTVAP